MAATELAQEPTYGNWRRPTTAGLGKLSSGTTIMLFGWLAIIICTLFFVGVLVSVVVAAAGGLMLAVLSIKDREHRTAAQRIASRAAFSRSRRRGHNLYRSGPMGVVPGGKHQLPGIAAASQLTQWEDSYNRPFALIRYPSTSDYVVVLATDPDGASLVDQKQVNQWVADWGAWLANLADEPGVIAAAVTIEAAPDTGYRLKREVHNALDPDAPAAARAIMQEVLDTYPSGAAQIKAWVAITVSAALRPGGTKRPTADVATDLAARLPALTAGLHATGAGAARPVGAAELCELVRTAYDPAAAVLFDQARAAGETLDLDWGDAGPAFHQANAGHYLHESAASVTWAMTHAPRGEVYSNVLARFLAPHPAIDRKRVTLLYRPHDPGQAADIVERDRNAANFRATGKRPTAQALNDQELATKAAKEEAKGAGLVSFGLLCTATVLGGGKEHVANAVAAIDSLSPSAKVRLRVVTGSQDSAFACALPLGIVPTRHVKVPTELRNNL